VKKNILFLLFICLLTASTGKLAAQANDRATLTATAQGSEPQLVVYPNPATSTVNLSIKHPQLKLKSVVIYSIIGVQIAEFNNINQSEIDLRLDRLRPGKYLLRYTLSDNSQKVTQLIKQL